MKKHLLSFIAIIVSVFLYAERESRPVTFAWISDNHLGSFAYAQDDLFQAIEDINANDVIEFVVLSGDLTEFGETEELTLLKSMLARLNKPYLLTTGNHDVNWSENGCTIFEGLFGSTNFYYDAGEIRFIGCGSGPSLRMGPPHIPHEDILWLDSLVRATPQETPIIFINHFPIDRGLANWYEVIDILKTKNTQFILCGHGHANRTFDFEGIPGVMGRSLLRRSDPIGGYNIVTIDSERNISFSERTIKTETHPAWHRAKLAPVRESSDTTYYRPDYSVNDNYPAIKCVWQLKDVTDVASQAEIDGDLFVYTNTAGTVHAMNAKTGETIWKYRTGNKIFSAPFITKDEVIISSTDGFIYSLKRDSGKKIWEYNTGYPIVACPLVVDRTIYIGSSNGKFYSLNLADGSENWVCEGLKGYIESRPAADKMHVYTGTWGAMFYAIDRKTGEKVWEYDTKRGRYISPGACWPVVSNGQVIVLSCDYFLRAFDPATGKIIWESNEAKGRESIGVSHDNNTIYVKGVAKNIDAIDISSKEYDKKWSVLMPYESNFVPTRMENTDDLVFIPTEFGVVHAVKTDGSGIAWSYKVAHSSVTSINNAERNRVIVITMNGTISCLEY